MFERYTDDAKRALFFARDVLIEYGGSEIEPEHVVLGILRAAPEAIEQFASGEIDALRITLEEGVGAPHHLSWEAEAPFSTQTIRVIEQASVEADGLSNATIRAQHLVLGILVKTSGSAALALSRAGLKIPVIREALSAGERE